MVFRPQIQRRASYWLAYLDVLIFIYACARTIRKPLSLYLETRSKDIRQKIEEGAIAKTQSEEKLKYYEGKLKSLNQEVELLKATFNEQAHAIRIERARSLKETEVRILKDTDDAIKANYERSKNRLAEEVIKKAMTLAEETIATKNRHQVDQLLQTTFIEDLKATATAKDMGNDISASDRKTLRQRTYDVYQEQ